MADEWQAIFAGKCANVPEGIGKQKNGDSKHDTELEVKIRKSIAATPDLRDKEDLSVVHEAGEVLEFELDRAHDVVERGLAEYSDPIG